MKTLVTENFEKLIDRMVNTQAELVKDVITFANVISFIEMSKDLNETEISEVEGLNSELAALINQYTEVYNKIIDSYGKYLNK